MNRLLGSVETWINGTPQDGGFMEEGHVQTVFYDETSTTGSVWNDEDEQDEDDGEQVDNYVIYETTMRKESVVTPSLSSPSLVAAAVSSNQVNYVRINPNEQDRCCSHFRPPFHVTAMYLWTQFNVSYLLRKFSFLFDNNHHLDDHDDGQYVHLVTIHYLDSGIADIIIMNLVITLFLSTAYVCRPPPPQLQQQQQQFLSTPSAQTVTSGSSLLQRRHDRSLTYLLEFVTVVTLVLLVLRLHDAAFKVLLVGTIYMFIHIICWFIQSLSVPSMLIFPYKL